MPVDPVGPGHGVYRRLFPASDDLESLEFFVLLRVRVGVDIRDTGVRREQVVVQRALKLLLAQERLGPVDAVLALGIRPSAEIDLGVPYDTDVFAPVPHAILLAIERRRQTPDVSLLPRILLLDHRLSSVRAVEDAGHVRGAVDPEIVDEKLPVGADVHWLRIGHICSRLPELCLTVRSDAKKKRKKRLF